jgi:hypothetical protein
MWYIYTMEYYSIVKKNEIMLLAGKWMDLEVIILSEIRQAQRASVMFSLVWNLDTKLMMMMMGRRKHECKRETGKGESRGREWGREKDCMGV